MRQLRWFIALVLLFGALGVLGFFVVSNKTEIPVELPFVAKLYQPVWLVLAAAFFAGACSASAGLLFQLAKKSLAARRFQKRVAGLETELDLLRKLPPAASQAPIEPKPTPPGS